MIKWKKQSLTENKRGGGVNRAFTLVELVVVIAIIAVLAAVSVAGYFGFTDKARQSNDVSLVKQMNDVTSAYVYEENPLNVPRVKRIISENGITVTSTQRKGNYIFYNPNTHKFVLSRLGDMNIKPSNETKDPNVFTYDVYPSTPETFISLGLEKYMLVDGNKNDSLVNAVELLRNLGDREKQPTYTEVIETINKVGNPEIKEVLKQMVTSSVFVGSKNSVYYSETAENVKGADGKTYWPERIIFSENVKELDSSTFPSEGVNYSSVMYVVIPSTVESVAPNTFDNLTKDITNMNITLVLEGGMASSVKSVIKNEVKGKELLAVKEGDMKEAYTYVRDAGIRYTKDFNDKYILGKDPQSTTDQTYLDKANESISNFALLTERVNDTVSGTYGYNDKKQLTYNGTPITKDNAIQNPDGSYDVDVILSSKFAEFDIRGLATGIISVFSFVFEKLQTEVSLIDMMPEGYTSMRSFVEDQLRASYKYLDDKAIELLDKNLLPEDVTKSDFEALRQSIKNCIDHASEITDEIMANPTVFANDVKEVYVTNYSGDYTGKKGLEEIFNYERAPVFIDSYDSLLKNLIICKILDGETGDAISDDYGIGESIDLCFLLHTTIINRYLTMDISQPDNDMVFFAMLILAATTFKASDYSIMMDAFLSLNGGIDASTIQRLYDSMVQGSKVRVIGTTSDKAGKVSYIRYNFEFIKAILGTDGVFTVA